MDWRRSHPALLCWLVLGVLHPSPAAAWPHEGTELHPGLIYRRLEGPLAIPGTGTTRQIIHVLYVDTWNGEVSFTASQPADRHLTVSQFAERHGLAAAINANYFDRDRAPCGLMVGGGEVWPDTYHHLPWGRCSSSVGFDRENEVSFFDSFEALRGPPPGGATEVVSGMPPLVRDGVVVDAAELSRSDYAPNLRGRNRRTALGLHEDGRTVLLVVVEGREPQRRGLTGMGLARLMRDVLGCRQALALDGGGSSAMFVRDQPPATEGGAPGLVSYPGPRGERGLCCHLGVRLTPGERMWRAELVEASPDPVVSAGQTFSLWARWRNAGRRTWRVDGRWPVALVLGEETFPSPFSMEAEWPGPATPAELEAPVGPGEEALVTFRALADLDPGVYSLSLRPEVEGGLLSAPAATWQVTVEPSPPAPLRLVDPPCPAEVDGGTLSPRTLTDPPYGDELTP